MCAARRLPARSAPGGRAQDLRNDRAAGSELEAVLRQPGGDALLKDLFRTQPDAAEVFAGHVEHGLRNAATTQAASHQAKTLALSRAASLLIVERQHALERLADETFAAANRSAIPFTLDDDLSGLAMLHTDAQRHVIVERGIAFLMHGGGPRTIDGLLAQIDRIGRDSTEARAILARLPKMNIRRSELARIAPYAPDFARRHESRPVTRVALQLRMATRSTTPTCRRVARAPRRRRSTRCASRPWAKWCARSWRFRWCSPPTNSISEPQLAPPHAIRLAT